MANILVTGATGMLGCRLVPLLQTRGHQVTQLGHTHVTQLNADLVSYEQTVWALDQVRPEVIINLTALTNVDRCETHPQEAYLLNVKPVENLSSWIQLTGGACHLIQISSDQVYDGPGPHPEGEVTIRNLYAMSKLAGEFVAGTSNSTILRTNFVGRSVREGRTSFTDWLYCAVRGRTPVNVFDDVMFSPLAISTLCECIECAAVERPMGVFNLGSRDGMSKADFAFAFADALGMPTDNLKRGSVGAAEFTARRPRDMRMHCQKFERLTGIRLPRLIDEIKVLAQDYTGVCLSNPATDSR
jgi:dTDP-4-dehydrorhamnose reductase